MPGSEPRPWPSRSVAVCSGRRSPGAGSTPTPARTMPFDELLHGAAGLEAAVIEFFQLPARSDALVALVLAGMRKRVANKRLCPCRSGWRLGRCHNVAINTARRRFGRAFFREQAAILRSHCVQ